MAARIRSAHDGGETGAKRNDTRLRHCFWAGCHAVDAGKRRMHLPMRRRSRATLLHQRPGRAAGLPGDAVHAQYAVGRAALLDAAAIEPMRPIARLRCVRELYVARDLSVGIGGGLGERLRANGGARFASPPRGLNG